MKVTTEDILHIASLSRLRIAKDEEASYREDLDKIISYMDILEGVDTKDTPPTTYALPMENVFREDVVKESLPRELVLSNAPEEEDGYFKVPRVLEES